MICRLCLLDLNGAIKDFIEVFPEEYDERLRHYNTVAVDLINKYFHIIIESNDSVSTKVCTSCWQQLDDFNTFYLMVNEKQQQLFLTKSNQLLSEEKLASNDSKDIVLSDSTVLIEPEIYANQDDNDNDCYEACNIPIPNCNSDSDDHLDEATTENPSSMITTIENFLQDEETMASTTTTTTMTQFEVEDKAKTRVKKTINRPKQKQRTLKSTIATIPRRTLRSHAIQSAVEPSTDEIDEGTIALQKQKKLNIKMKRGRPKISNSSSPSPKGPISKESQEQRRAAVLEMDQFIAANVKLDCCLCGTALEDFRVLKQHFRDVHNCNGYVKCCNNRYNKRALYVDHLNLHRNPEYFRCGLCKKNYVNRNSYEMHMLRFHTDKQDKVYECDVCGQRFAKMYLLTMHKKSHKSLERKEVCQICDRAFRTPFELKAHVKRMHDDSFEPVICDICGSHFRNESNFITHKKTVHREGPPEPEVQCHLCGRWLRDKRCLRRHIHRHEDGTLFKCDKCDVVKTTRAALSSHIRYHHTSKRHQCTLCGKEFKIPRNLKEHMATHTGIDLYNCPFCPRTFKSHANMHNHKKKMHPKDWVPKYSMPSNPPLDTSNVTSLLEIVGDGNGNSEATGDMLDTLAV